MTDEALEPATMGPRAREPDGEALEMLVSFIATAFEQRHELRGLVRQLHDGQALLTTLPGEIASAAYTAHALVAAVTSRGLLDADFFALLLRTRPHMSARINTIRQRCLSVDEPAGTPAPGVILRAGRYKLEELVDHGGVASVWRAVDRRNDTDVAIKVLRRDMRDYKLRRWQFIKGANHLARISHPRVAAVIEPHFREMGLDFCVLEYVHGRSLAEEIKSGRLQTLQAIVGVILDIGTGLATLHPRIFHGDISPKNIIISADGHATLVDFDLASDIDELPMTRATGLPGTDPYASPEWRIRGDVIDARTDIFSLGMTAVYALYGGANLPSGLNDSRVVAGLGPFLDKNLSCDAAVKAVLARACAFDLSERYETVRQFCHDLRQATLPLLRTRRSSIGPNPAPSRQGLAVAPAASTTLATPVPIKPGPLPTLAPAAASHPDPPEAPRSSRPEAAVGLKVTDVTGVLAALGDQAPATTAIGTRPRQKHPWPAIFAGGATFALGLALWGAYAPQLRSSPGPGDAPVAFVNPGAPSTAVPSTGGLSEDEQTRARTAIRNMGLNESNMMQATLQQIIDDPTRSSQAVAGAQLLQAELLLMRALCHQIALRLDSSAQGGQLSVRAAEDARAAEDLLSQIDQDIDPAQLGRVRALQALVKGSPPTTSPSPDEALVVLGRASSLWQGEATPPPPGLITSLRRLSAPSSLTGSVLALALWRSGDIDEARRQLRAILAQVPDHPLALVLLATMDHDDSVPEVNRPGPEEKDPSTPPNLPNTEHQKPPKPERRKSLRPGSKDLPKPGNKKVPEPPELPREPEIVQTFESMRKKLSNKLISLGKECKTKVYQIHHLTDDEQGTYNIRVDTDGQVTQATPSGEWAGTKLETCVTARVTGQQFGAFQGAPRSIEITFNF